MSAAGKNVKLLLFKIYFLLEFISFRLNLVFSRWGASQFLAFRHLLVNFEIIQIFFF